MDSGYFINRRLVMHNDFLIVGPAEDPARVRGSTNATDALRRIANTQGPFVSRGDRSGTHMLEQKLWKPRGRWYIESGQGMAATLQMADQKHAYTLTDRATYLAWRDRLQLVPLVEGDTLLFNVYHVMEARQGGAGARALAEFLVSPEAQAVIGRFGTTRFGRPLFIPDAVQP
jgi:tungstate transport system substrate-binding protein